VWAEWAVANPNQPCRHGFWKVQAAAAHAVPALLSQLALPSLRFGMAQRSFPTSSSTLAYP